MYSIINEAILNLYITSTGRSGYLSDDVEAMKQFLDKESGAVAVSQGVNVISYCFLLSCLIMYFFLALCYTHLVQLSGPGIKRFTPPFVDAVKHLSRVSKFKDNSTRLEAFKQFVKEFGTHYASITFLGTKLVQQGND